MQEMRCHNVDDFGIVVIKQHNANRPPVDASETEKWEYQESYTRLVLDAPGIWDKLIKDNQSIYDRLGYLDIIVHDDFTCERKKLTRGRPKKDKTRDYVLNVRLDDELRAKLKEYCTTSNQIESDVIRQLIKKL